MLYLLEIKGSIITIDAIEMQTAIAEKIIEKEADYILAVKDNQKGLREEGEATCNHHRPVMDVAETEKGHGRIETSRCQVFEKGLIVDSDECWKGLLSVIKITSTRCIKEQSMTEERYYISSLDTKQPFNRYVRNHWGVKNSLHWTLYMFFSERRAAETR